MCFESGALKRILNPPFFEGDRYAILIRVHRHMHLTIGTQTFTHNGRVAVHFVATDICRSHQNMVSEEQTFMDLLK